MDPHIVLRVPVEADAEPIFELVDANRAHLRRWLPWVDGTTSAATVRAFLHGVLERTAEGTALEFVIEHDGQLAGLSGFRILDPTNRIGALGYWLREDFGGHGIMTACCRTLVRHGFESLDLNRISLAAAVENTRSRRVAERLGFQLEGVLREAGWLYDHFVDMAVYSILRSEWQK
ncbi:MAG TPA: GNAT family protein [Myxococcota bacterium]|nr:GNAT family protein [Myxococcota bacterium]